MVLSIVLAILATYRLAQLVALDDGPFDCFVFLRDLTVYSYKNKQRYLKRRGPVWHSLEELVNCPYCLGVWFAGLMTVVIAQIEPLNIWTGLLIWLGIAGGQCALQSITDKSR